MLQSDPVVSGSGIGGRRRRRSAVDDFFLFYLSTDRLRVDSINPCPRGMTGKHRSSKCQQRSCAPQAPAPASTHLLDRGPGGKLTRGWVKIVVDNGARALPTFIGRSMFVCFAIHSTITCAGPQFWYLRTTSQRNFLRTMLQNGSNKDLWVGSHRANKYCCSPYTAFPASTSGQHPMYPIGY